MQIPVFCYYFNVIFFSEKDGKGGRKDRSRDMKKVDTAESSEDEDSSPAGSVPTSIVTALLLPALKVARCEIFVPSLTGLAN
jgi:hypothetical protein